MGARLEPEVEGFPIRDFGHHLLVDQDSVATEPVDQADRGRTNLNLAAVDISTSGGE